MRVFLQYFTLMVLAVPDLRADSLNVRLFDKTYLLQDGSRIVGASSGGTDGLQAPPDPNLIPWGPLPPDPVPGALQEPANPDMSLRGLRDRLVSPAAKQRAALPSQGPAPGTPPGPAGPDYDAFVAWMTGQYGMTDSTRPPRIWPYFLDEIYRFQMPGRTVDSRGAGNAVARYLTATRDPMGGRFDWNRIDPNYQGPARAEGVGIFMRKFPGGPQSKRLNTPANLEIGRKPSKGGWFHATDADGDQGYVSVYWIVFP